LTEQNVVASISRKISTAHLGPNLSAIKRHGARIGGRVMPASEVYHWYWIAAGAKVGVYVHGYPWHHVGVYGAQMGTLDEFASPTEYAINLTQGINRRHYDNTYAKEAWVQNIGLLPAPVTLYELWDIVPST
jgi:hypothetical protein